MCSSMWLLWWWRRSLPSWANRTLQWKLPHMVSILRVASAITEPFSANMDIVFLNRTMGIHTCTHGWEHLTITPTLYELYFISFGLSIELLTPSTAVATSTFLVSLSQRFGNCVYWAKKKLLCCQVLLNEMTRLTTNVPIHCNDVQ